MSYNIRDSNGNILYSVENTIAIKPEVSFESINIELKELKKINDYSNKLNDTIKTFNFISDNRAMESFGYRATEGFGEKVKAVMIKIIEALKIFFKRFKEFIISFWRKIKDGFKKFLEFFKKKEIKESKIVKGKEVTGNLKMYNPKEDKEIIPDKEYALIRFKRSVMPTCVSVKDIMDIINSGEWHIKIPNNRMNDDINAICKFIKNILAKLSLEVDSENIVELDKNETINLNDHKLVIKEKYEYNDKDNVIKFITDNFYNLSKLTDDNLIGQVIKMYTNIETQVQDFLSYVKSNDELMNNENTKKLLDSISDKKNIMFESYTELTNYLSSLSRIYAGCGLIINNAKPIYKMMADKKNNYQPILDTEGRTLIQLNENIRLSKSEFDEFLKNENIVKTKYKDYFGDSNWANAIDKEPSIREYVRKLMKLCSKRNLKLAKYVGGDNFVLYYFDIDKPTINVNNEVIVNGKGVVDLSIKVDPNEVKALYHTSFTKGITELHTNKGASKTERIYYGGDFNRLYVGINEPVIKNGFTIKEMISKHLTANIFPDLKNLRIYKIDLNSIDKNKIFLDSEHNGNTMKSKNVKGFKRVAAFIKIEGDEDIPCVDVTETEFKDDMKKLNVYY